MLIYREIESNPTNVSRAWANGVDTWGGQAGGRWLDEVRAVLAGRSSTTENNWNNNNNLNKVENNSNNNNDKAMKLLCEVFFLILFSWYCYIFVFNATAYFLLQLRQYDLQQ